VWILLIGAIIAIGIERRFWKNEVRRAVVTAFAQPNSPSGSEATSIHVSGRAAVLAQLERGDAEEAGRIAQAEDLARNFHPDEFEDAAKQAVRIPLRYRSAYLSALAAHWAKSDPKSALDFASGIKDGAMRSSAISAALDQWIGAEREVALSWILQEIQGKAGQFAWPAVGVLQKRDPVAALAFIDSLPTMHARPYSYQGFFEAWTKADPEAASRAALAMKPGENRSASIGYVADAWAATNPEATLQWAKQIPELRLRDEVTERALVTWSEKNPEAALRWMNQLDDERFRKRMEMQAWNSWAARDFDGARRAAVALPAGEQRNEMLRTLALQRVYQNIPSALEVMQGLPESMQPGVLRDMVQRMSRMEIHNHQEVCELVLRLPIGEDRTRALSEVSSQWATDTPEAVAQWLQQNCSPTELRNTLPSVAGAWAANDPDAAMTWARGITDEAIRGWAVSRVVMSIADKKPERAAELFANVLPVDLRQYAAGTLAMSWSSRDATAAARWAESLPPGGGQEEALRSVASAWAKLDYVRAADWLQRLPAGGGRDVAVIQFTNTLADTDPEGAITWATTVADSAKRAQHVEGLAGRWLSFDKQRAQQWIAETNQLPPEVKARLLLGKGSGR